jgi:hypothetical protein
VKSNFFNPLQLKHLMAHKGSYLKAITTDEGLRFCPDFAQNIMHVLDPVPVKMDVSDIRGADGRNITYMIEDGYQIAKLADALDFTKAEVTKDGDNLDFVVGKKHFRMKLFSASEPYFDLNLEGYSGTVEWDAAGSEAMQICNVASFEIGQERLFLQGVFIDPEGMFVATDGCRMIYHKSCNVAGLGEFLKAHPSKCTDNTFIMPTWTIPYLDGYAKVFYAYHDVEAKDADHYPLHTQWSYWKLETGGETYLFHPIEGQFPKWRKVAPEYMDLHYEHKKTTFDFEGMKRYKKTGKNDSMLCRFHDGTCTQMYNGEIELDIGVEFPLPENVDAFFDAQYLIDGVKVFGKQAEVDIALPDPDEGHIIKAVDIVGKHDLLHYVVMPRRAN